MSIFDVGAYYSFVTSKFPELHDLAKQIRAEHGDDLYPFLWNLLGPLLVNVGAHGAGERRAEVFQVTDDLIVTHPEITNEIGAGIIEVVQPGWFAVAAQLAGPALRRQLDVWEPGWQRRGGPRRRLADPYGVEKVLRLR